MGVMNFFSVLVVCVCAAVNNLPKARLPKVVLEDGGEAVKPATLPENHPEQHVNVGANFSQEQLTDVNTIKQVKFSSNYQPPKLWTPNAPVEQHGAAGSIKEVKEENAYGQKGSANQEKLIEEEKELGRCGKFLGRFLLFCT